MPALSYRQPGLVIAIDSPASRQQVCDLQHDLRSLGYLRRGIDGAFGPGTRKAVMAFQYDLLKNAGKGSDGSAPVRVVDYNRGRVSAVDGRVDQSLVAVISDVLDDAAFPKLPFSKTPAEDNRKIAVSIAALPRAGGRRWSDYALMAAGLAVCLWAALQSDWAAWRMLLILAAAGTLLYLLARFRRR